MIPVSPCDSESNNNNKDSEGGEATGVGGASIATTEVAGGASVGGPTAPVLITESPPTSAGGSVDSAHDPVAKFQFDLTLEDEQGESATEGGSGGSPAATSHTTSTTSLPTIRHHVIHFPHAGSWTYWRKQRPRSLMCSASQYIMCVAPMDGLMITEHYNDW